MRKIILAEDDEAIVQVVKIILEEQGYGTIITQSEQEIYDFIKGELPAMILLDVHISGQNGGEIAKRLKTKPETQQIPVVIMSANNETEEIAKASGADDFLLKPFDISELLTLVRKYAISS